MRPLPSPRTIPENNARYACIPVAGKGEHHVRFPTYGAMADLFRAVRERAPAIPEGEAPEWGDYIRAEEHVAGLVIGRTWFHRGFALESEEGEDVVAYGVAVADELVERGYTFTEYQALSAEILSRMTDFYTAGIAVQVEGRQEGKD